MLSFHLFIAFTQREMKVPFSMAIGNGELMWECFPKHSRMGTARMKEDKETDEEGRKRGVSIERSKAGTKRRSPDGQSLPEENRKRIKQNMVLLYKIWKKYNEIQSTVNRVEQTKNEKSSALRSEINT